MIDKWQSRVQLKELEKQKLTKKEVTEKLQCDRKMLYGYGAISLPHFAGLCQVLNVSADYLLFGEREENKNVDNQ